MELLLKREADNGKFVAGTLYVDGEEFCKTLEPSGINPTHPGHPCVPAGRYEVRVDIVSPKFSNFGKYPYLRGIGGKMPRLMNVPERSGILIHPGNGRRDTHGCILVGRRLVEETLEYSRVTFLELYKKLSGRSLACGGDEGVWIEIR